jgi:integrase
MLKGRAREMGLGAAHTFTLADARQRAQEQRKHLADGVDPIAHREAERARKALEQSKTKTFGECANDYIAEHRHEWKNAKHIEQWVSTINTYCAAILNLPVQGVDTGRVLGVLKPIWNEKRETAVRLRGRIEQILDAARVAGYRDGENPAKWRGNLKHLLAKDKRRKRIKHHAALPFDQAGALMLELREQQGVAPRALEFTVLTAARTGETIGLKWPELDLEGAVWTVPAERMKAGHEHRVPLSLAAVELLRNLPKAGDYVFPSRGRNKPLSNMAMLQLLERMDRGDLTVHGFRSTFRDWAAERTSFPNHVVEMALAHAVADDTEASYRRGDLFEKRRKLMEAWANFLSTAESAKVTAIRKAS